MNLHEDNKVKKFLLAIFIVSLTAGTTDKGFASDTYNLELDSPKSSFIAVTRRAGLLGFLGHEHAILASKFQFKIECKKELSRRPFWGWLDQCSAEFEIPVSELEVDTAKARQAAQLESSGPTPGDVQKIHEKMLSPDLLDAKKFPLISFKTKSVEAVSEKSALLKGVLSLHGIEREISVPVQVDEPAKKIYHFMGSFKIKHTDYGMTPVSIAGVVKVEDEIELRLDLVVKGELL